MESDWNPCWQFTDRLDWSTYLCHSLAKTAKTKTKTKSKQDNWDKDKDKAVMDWTGEHIYVIAMHWGANVKVLSNLSFCVCLTVDISIRRFKNRVLFISDRYKKEKLFSIQNITLTYFLCLWKYRNVLRQNMSYIITSSFTSQYAKFCVEVMTSLFSKHSSGKALRWDSSFF